MKHQDSYNPFEDPFNDDEQYEQYQLDMERKQHKALAFAVVLVLVSLVVLFVFAGSALVVG